MNRLQEDVTWLAALLQSEGGQPVTLEQAFTKLTNVVAVPFPATHDVRDARGSWTKVIATDWLFVVADLGGLVIKSGAVITTAEGKTYEALPIAGKDCTEPHGFGNKMLLVRTKETTRS